MTDETDGSITTGDGFRSEETIPVERWETAESSAREPVGSNGGAPAELRWRRSLVVLTTSDTNTNEVGA
jgi:hypothetical protein